MSRPFNQTTRSLKNDKAFASLVFLGLGFLFILLWSIWFLTSRITINKNSVSAQIIQSGQVSVLNSPIDGEITQIFIELGAPVKAGELIAELNHNLIDAKVSESKESLQRINSQLAREQETHRNLVDSHLTEMSSLREHLESLRTQLNSEKDVVEIEKGIVKLYEQLTNKGSGSQLDLKTSLLELEKLRAGLISTQTEMAESNANLAGLSVRQDQEKAQLLKSIDTLELQRIQETSAHQQNLVELQRHFITAPSSGFISAFAVLRTGQYLQQGENIGTILSDSGMRIEAQFSAIDAVGHIKVGQQARVKVDGFEWTTYGAILAKVRKVASSSHEGYFQVELEILESPAQIPLKQEMPVSVDVVIESISPFSLVLKTAAHWVN